MIIGHYATALIPHSRQPQAPFWLFLLCANLQDFFWLLFAAIGVEPTLPRSMLDVAFNNIVVEMTYSHDLLPTFGWMLFAAAIGFAVTRNRAIAAWCAALSGVHFLSDLLSGFEHHVAGPSTATIGFNFYGTNPYLALVIEAVFAGLLVFAYSRLESRAGRPLSNGKQALLYAIFVGGALVWLPTAEKSLGEWFR